MKENIFTSGRRFTTRTTLPRLNGETELQKGKGSVKYRPSRKCESSNSANNTSGTAKRSWRLDTRKPTVRQSLCWKIQKTIEKYKLYYHPKRTETIRKKRSSVSEQKTNNRIKTEKGFWIPFAN